MSRTRRVISGASDGLNFLEIAADVPLTVPATPSLALAAGSELGVGLYQYAISFVTANGETTRGKQEARLGGLGKPAGEGPGMHDGDQVLYGRAQLLAQLDQRGFLGLGHLDPLGQLAPQDPVLGLQVFDVQDQVFFGRLGQEEQ